MDPRAAPSKLTVLRHRKPKAMPKTPKNLICGISQVCMVFLDPIRTYVFSLMLQIP